MKSLLFVLLLAAVMPCAGQLPAKKDWRMQLPLSIKSNKSFNYDRIRDLQPGYHITIPLQFHFMADIGLSPQLSRADVRYSSVLRDADIFQSLLIGIATGIVTTNNYPNNVTIGEGASSWPSFLVGAGLGILVGNR